MVVPAAEPDLRRLRRGQPRLHVRPGQWETVALHGRDDAGHPWRTQFRGHGDDPADRRGHQELPGQGVLDGQRGDTAYVPLTTPPAGPVTSQSVPRRRRAVTPVD